MPCDDQEWSVSVDGQLAMQDLLVSLGQLSGYATQGQGGRGL